MGRMEDEGIKVAGQMVERSRTLPQDFSFDPLDSEDEQLTGKQMPDNAFVAWCSKLQNGHGHCHGVNTFH